MTIPDPLLDRMTARAAEWEVCGDKRYIFLQCYTLMTSNMLEAVRQGRFSDPVWVENLLRSFAGYYFDALSMYEGQPDQTPAVWKQAHDASCTGKLHVMQHLLLGVNDHINYDLVLALYDEIAADWQVMSVEQRTMRKSDHDQVNRIIAETIDRVQDEVIEKHSPFMAVVDRLMGRVDEWMLSELISGWRREVWNETCTMLAATTPEQRDEMKAALEAKVMKKATQMLTF